MQKLRVAGRGFERVADSVPEVENTAQIRLLFVGGNYGGLHADRVRDDPLQRVAVAGKDFLGMPAHEIEERSVTNHATFERLEQAGAKFALVECGEHIRIDQYGVWLMKRADQIFATAKIHAG